MCSVQKSIASFSSGSIPAKTPTKPPKILKATSVAKAAAAASFPAGTVGYRLTPARAAGVGGLPTGL